MRNVIEVDTRAELLEQWRILIERLNHLDEITVEDFGEILIVFGRMRRAGLNVGEGAFALLAVLARQAFEFDGDQDEDSERENSDDEMPARVRVRR